MLRSISQKFVIPQPRVFRGQDLSNKLNIDTQAPKLFEALFGEEAIRLSKEMIGIFSGSHANENKIAVAGRYLADFAKEKVQFSKFASEVHQEGTYARKIFDSNVSLAHKGDLGSKKMLERARLRSTSDSRLICSREYKNDQKRLEEEKLSFEFLDNIVNAQSVSQDDVVLGTVTAIKKIIEKYKKDLTLISN